MTRRKKFRPAGFTLIEIMVVVVILGILATLVVPNIMGKPDQARRTAAQQGVRAITSALNLYRLEHASYPHTLDELTKGASRYLGSSDLNDPWGNEYQYSRDGYRSGTFDLYSYGSDGQEGGNDLDADIGNWNLQDG